MTAPDVLYTQLIELCKLNPAFFFKDFPSDEEDTMYRIFNYRLGSYSDWLIPGALECRGSMFLVERDGTYIDMVCRPPKKFFNLNENPFTLGLDLMDPLVVMLKDDGSLMSSYIHTSGEIRLKSKGSTGSVQAEDAMKFLNKPENKGLKTELAFLAGRDMTVNLEWVAPWNRIVVGYEKAGLIAHSIIDNATGRVYLKDFVQGEYLTVLEDNWVKDYEYQGSLEGWVSGVTDHEGVVAIAQNGTWVKIKSDWYLALHRSKDSVNNPRALIEVILNEGSDDLKTMFAGDQLVIDKITVYEDVINTEFNTISHLVETHYIQNRDLDRKDYAIKSQEVAKTINSWVFNVMMSIYVGKDYSTQIKEMILKNYRDYVIPGLDVGEE